MTKRSLAVLSALLLSITTIGFAGDHGVHQPTLTSQNSGTTNLLIAVSAASPRVAWVAGANGTFLRTTNGGQTWQVGVVPGAETLQFRDVEAVSDKVAYLLSISPSDPPVPTDFRIYKTTDGGKTWTMQFQNHLAGAFYDCMAFWTPLRGLAHSDSVNGVFPDIRTRNGHTWESISANMPPALPGEASFASSGTCVATQGGRNAWIATGGASVARILATRDGGNTWNAYDTPLVSSPSAGAFTVAFRTPWNGIVGGGDLDPNDPNNARTAVSHDGGMTWTLTAPPPVTGAIFGLAYVDGVGHNDDRDGMKHNEDHDGEGSRSVVITADKGGAAWTPDEGKTWYSLPNASGFWGVTFASPKAGWMVGRNGQILKVSFQEH